MTPIEALSTIDSPAARTAIRQGKTFAVAMERMGCFSPSDLSAITMGEQSGALAQSLYLLAKHYAQRDRDRKKLWTAVLYPLILFLIAPILVNVPALLTGEISLGNYLLQITTLPVLLLGGRALARAVERHPGRRSTVRVVLRRVPLLGPMLRQDRSRTFLCSARILIGAGVGIRAAFRDLAASSRDPQLVEAIQTWEENLEQGMSLSNALSAVEVLDPEARQLLANAAHSGRLEEALETLTSLHATTTGRRVQRLYTLIRVGGVLLLAALLAAWML